MAAKNKSHRKSKKGSDHEYRALLKNDLGMFIERSFLHLNPQAEYLHNWHLDLMVHYLERVRRGECKRLIINVPPRSLKSHCASIALPAFWLGHDPSAQILCVSYGQDLADKLSMDCRNVMQDDGYKDLFKTRLSPHQQSKAEFATTANGFRKATSIGGVLTGRGADVIIIDDPLKPDEALSDTQRKFVNDWHDGTLYSRLNDKTKGAIILIMQRLHQDDLVGYLVEKGGWEHLSFPAIAQEDEVFQIQTQYGVRKFMRRAGEALHPGRESLEALEQIRQTIGEYNFAGQYQQSPVPPGGGLIKQAWLQYYEPGSEPAHFDMIVHSWDTANKETQLSDYSACTVWGLKGKQIYLLQVLRRRMNYPELKRAVLEMNELRPADAILIEDKASGTQLIQDLKEDDGLWSVHACEPEGNKVMRLHAQSLRFENGLVYLPTEASWLDDYVQELTIFPKAKHDDQVDSTSQALAWMRNDRGPDYERLNRGMPGFLGDYLRRKRFFFDGGGWSFG